MDAVAYNAMVAAGTLPRKGDKVRLLRPSGRFVSDTYYQNGSAGISITYDFAPYGSWACCTDVEVVERAQHHAHTWVVDDHGGRRDCVCGCAEVQPVVGGRWLQVATCDACRAAGWVPPAH